MVHGQTTGHHGQTVKQSCPQTVTTNLTDKRAQMGKNQNETNMSSNEEVEKGGTLKRMYQSNITYLRPLESRIQKYDSA